MNTEYLDEVYEITGHVFSSLEEAEQFFNTESYVKELSKKYPEKLPLILVFNLKDGSKLHIHPRPEEQGIPIDWKYYNRLTPITLDSIKSEPNSEKRRLLIMKFGLSRFKEEMEFKKVQEDKYGVLYYVDNEIFPTQYFVQVINGTPEPKEKIPELLKEGLVNEHGCKYYFIPCDAAKTAKEAVAKSFGLYDDDFKELLTKLKVKNYEKFDLPDEGFDFES